MTRGRWRRWSKVRAGGGVWAYICMEIILHYFHCMYISWEYAVIEDNNFHIVVSPGSWYVGVKSSHINVIVALVVEWETQQRTGTRSTWCNAWGDDIGSFSWLTTFWLIGWSKGRAMRSWWPRKVGGPMSQVISHQAFDKEGVLWSSGGGKEYIIFWMGGFRICMRLYHLSDERMWLPT